MAHLNHVIILQVKILGCSSRVYFVTIEYENQIRWALLDLLSIHLEKLVKFLIL